MCYKDRAILHVDLGDPKIVFQNFANIAILSFGDLVNEWGRAMSLGQPPSSQEDSQKRAFFPSPTVTLIWGHRKKSLYN
jgi:hypothetical protein